MNRNNAEINQQGAGTGHWLQRWTSGASLMNTDKNYASGKPSDPLRSYTYVHDSNLLTAPPNHGHDAEKAVGYNCASIKPSIFNCDWKPPGFSFTFSFTIRMKTEKKSSKCFSYSFHRVLHKTKRL